MPETISIAVPKRGKRRCPARAKASEVSACVTGSKILLFQS
jgi:hypothetical protein